MSRAAILRRLERSCCEYKAYLVGLFNIELFDGIEDYYIMRNLYIEGVGLMTQMMKQYYAHRCWMW